MSRNMLSVLERPPLWVLAVLAVLAMPGSAGAEVQTFHRFEAVATANFIVNQQCPDGSTFRSESR